MPKTKVEVYDKDQLIYPYIESDHVTFSNGMKVSEMLDQSISMPKVIHNETSFKAGVGDSDVSSSIVDSSVSKMVIKGQTYQNILPEPSTHVLTNNKEMFKVNEGLDSNVEIVDGVSKSAILKGQTLVNLSSPHDEREIVFNSRYQNYYVTNDVAKSGLKNGEKIFMSMEVNIHEVNIETPNFRAGTCRETGGYDHIIKTNAEICNLPKNTWARLCAIREVKEVESSEQYSFWFGMRGEHPTTEGEQIARVSFRKPMWINLTSMFGKGKEPTLSECEKLSYFTGMQSVKMPVLQTVGKNLFDPTLHKGLTKRDGYYSVDITQAGNAFVEYKVEPNTQYTLKFDKYGTSSCWIGVTIDGAYNNNNNTHYSKTFTTNNTGKTTIRIGANGTSDLGHTIANIMLCKTNNGTTYEDHKTNILHTPEDVVLRGIGDVKDTLDCLTGEATQHIGEIVLNGSENWVSFDMYDVDGYSTFVATISTLNNLHNNDVISIINDKFASTSWGGYLANRENETVWSHDPNKIGIRIKTETASNVAELKAYLASNPIRFNYQLATPVIKTVDLSSSGNWEKIVLNGSENWVLHNNSGGYVEFRCGSMINNVHDSRLGFSDKFPVSTGGQYERIAIANGTTYITVKNNKAQSVEQLQSWLSQNPITVWYQTATHKDSTQVKQPIFFKDGHVIQSSGADNSLIPTLDYQAKTSNSYVMDLMKPNTRYTMKAKSASGTFTIDGTSYGAGTNGTFTTPSSMTNKFLVMSNKSNEEVMILEGDVVSKTIPYFKGIKSAFEDESKIEVLSTGKNLFDKSDVEFNYAVGNTNPNSNDYVSSNFIAVKPSTEYVVNNSLPVVCAFDVNKEKIALIKDNNSGGTFTTPSNCYFIRIRNHTQTTDHQSLIDVAQLEESPTLTTYEPYKSNNTKIPLLSPLRSLPNGVKDEVILDRENNKAKIIQRVGEITYDGADVWGTYTVHDNNVRIQTTLPNCVRRDTVDFIYAICDKLPSVIWNHSWLQNYNLVTINHTNIHLQLSDTTMTKQQMLSWLTQNPITVQYELAESIITEVDLEGFPYIYKDGHIFLNSEITPTMENTYSINQCQQISASNEDIIRHEKELTYLQKLIAQYIQVDYESALLSLKV